MFWDVFSMFPDDLRHCIASWNLCGARFALKVQQSQRNRQKTQVWPVFFEITPERIAGTWLDIVCIMSCLLETDENWWKLMNIDEHWWKLYENCMKLYEIVWTYMMCSDVPSYFNDIHWYSDFKTSIKLYDIVYYNTIY